MENQLPTDISFSAPSCISCKRQDHTLRAITFPFVISLLVVTFQRTFSGIYCAKHQRRYHVLASLITSLLGWLGIPFGFMLTPLTLIKLARGGVVHVEESFSILHRVADQKLRQGDTAAAIKCLEEALKLQDSHLVREKLSRLYAQHNSVSDRNITDSVALFLSVPVLLVCATVIGLIIGLADILINWLASPLFEGDISIIVAIVSWLPTVTLIFLGLVMVRALLRWSLDVTASTSVLFGSLLSVTSTLSLFYSILTGQMLLRNLQGLFMFFSISLHDGWFALRSLFTHGGIDVFLNDLNRDNLPGIIFAVLFSVGLCLSLYAGIELATARVEWRKRLTQSRQSQSTEFLNPLAVPWTILVIMLLGVLLANAILYPGRFVNIEKATEHFNLGLNEMDQHHTEQALEHFAQASEIWPDSVTCHTYLGMGYSSLEQHDHALKELDSGLRIDPDSMIVHLLKAYQLISRGQFEEAKSELRIVSSSQPEWGLPHALLALIYYNQDEVELAQQSIDQAKLLEAEDSQTMSMVGAYYVAVRDFDQAEVHFLKAIDTSNSAEDYLYLARTYISRQELDKAEKLIEDADHLGADPVSLYLSRSDLAIAQNDLVAAEAVLQSALKEFPTDNNVWADLSFVHFNQGKFDSAVTDATKSLEFNPYNSSAYIDLAFAYMEQNEVSDAFTATEKGLTLYPKHDRGHYLLGVYYMKMGMKKEAIQEFETFLDLYWDRPFMRQYKTKAEQFLEQLK